MENHFGLVRPEIVGLLPFGRSRINGEGGPQEVREFGNGPFFRSGIQEKGKYRSGIRENNFIRDSGKDEISFGNSGKSKYFFGNS